MVRCAAAWVADPEGGAGVGTVRTDRVAVMTMPLTARADAGRLAGDLAMGRTLTVGLGTRDLSSVRQALHRAAVGFRRIRRGLGLPESAG
jgi:hypothetical protein